MTIDEQVYLPADPPDPAQLPPHARLLLMVNGKQLAQSIYAAAKLGVADALADGPLTVDELAERTGCQPAPLYRVLRATATAGIFAELPGRRFALTRLAGPLRADAPDSVRHVAIMLGEDFMWRGYGHIMHTLRTGEVAFDHVHGEPLFGHLARHPERLAVFDTAMTQLSMESADQIVEDFDFSPYGVIADVGGGRGYQLAAILAAHPGATGVLFERPEVLAGAEAVLRERGVRDRAELVGGDFLTDVPVRADAYVVRSCLHCFDDADCLTVLRRIRAAVGDRQHARLLLVEAVLAPGNEWDVGKLIDIEMLVNLGGRERTADEWGRLLAAAGFRMTSLRQTTMPLFLIEAEPVPGYLPGDPP